MSDIKIRKAKLAKGGTVEASFYDQDGNDVTLKGKNICHADLKTAPSRRRPTASTGTISTMPRLSNHFAILK